jgi:hypothetical protein
MDHRSQTRDAIPIALPFEQPEFVGVAPRGRAIGDQPGRQGGGQGMFRKDRVAWRVREEYERGEPIDGARAAPRRGSWVVHTASELLAAAQQLSLRLGIGLLVRRQDAQGVL